MKYLILDNQEFDLDSEQSLLIASCHIKDFSSLIEFCNETSKADCLAPVGTSFSGDFKESHLLKLEHSSLLINDMKEFCAITLPSSSIIFVNHDTWDIHDYLFEHEHQYYRYVWATSA